MNIDYDSGMAFILRVGPWVDALRRNREGTGIHLCGCGRPTGLVALISAIDISINSKVNTEIDHEPICAV